MRRGTVIRRISGSWSLFCLRRQERKLDAVRRELGLRLDKGTSTSSFSYSSWGRLRIHKIMTIKYSRTNMNWVVKSEDRVTTGHRRLLLCAEHTDALLLQSTLYSIFFLLLFHFPAKKNCTRFSSHVTSVSTFPLMLTFLPFLVPELRETWDRRTDRQTDGCNQ